MVVVHIYICSYYAFNIRSSIFFFIFLSYICGADAAAAAAVLPLGGAASTSQKETGFLSVSYSCSAPNDAIGHQT